MQHKFCNTNGHTPNHVKESQGLDAFETPVTVTPQQKISKTLISSKFPTKYLTLTFGEQTFTFGERTFTFGDNQGFRFFFEFLFCCWGVLGLRGSGGPVGVFENTVS